MDFGIDRLDQIPLLWKRLSDARVGVLAHAASVDRKLQHLTDKLPNVHTGSSGAASSLRTLFGPEHGFGAAAQDMASVASARDPRTGARIVSLYGDAPEDLVPRASDLSDLDVLLIDLADVGARYYTFVWTALLATRAAVTAGVHTVILDRPNPLGDAIEGRTQEPGFTSFVGWERVPIRHGLTLAEMVLLHIDAELGPAGGVSVVTSDRAMAPSWDRPFVQPSPNMPTFETALVYPGGCLLEGTNLSEGRGHTRPFEVVGAPWLDGHRLAGDLMALCRPGCLPGFVARPVEFIPTFHKHAGEVCGGVQIHPLDVHTFKPVATYAALVALAQRQDPARFRFRTERYEFIDHIPAFDLLTGSDECRRAIEQHDDPAAIATFLSAADPDWPERMADARARVERARW